MSLVEILGNTVVDNQGNQFKVEDIIKENKRIGLYFSALWCPGCRMMTPVLSAIYEQMKADNKGLEIIFVSLDRDEKSWKSYFSKMPWKSLEFKDKSKRTKVISFTSHAF